jgi:hypothetical protein
MYCDDVNKWVTNAIPNGTSVHLCMVKSCYMCHAHKSLIKCIPWKYKFICVSNVYASITTIIDYNIILIECNTSLLDS